MIQIPWPKGIFIFHCIHMEHSYQHVGSRSRLIPWEVENSFNIMLAFFPCQVHQDRRQGGGVQPRVPPDPAHQAGQPPLQARDAGPDHPHQLHCDQGRSGGPAAGQRGGPGEARSGEAQGTKHDESLSFGQLIPQFRNSDFFFFLPLTCQSVTCGLGERAH